MAALLNNFLMNGMDLCCQEQNETECFYQMFCRCHISLYLKNLNFFKMRLYIVMHTVKNFKIQMLLVPNYMESVS